MVVPFLIIYIFNWTLFFIIIVSLLCKSCNSSVKQKQENISFVRQQLIIIVALSILFGLGWGVGLFATQDIHSNKTIRDIFAVVFVVITAFHGLCIFIMHCVRSQDVRNVWKKWLYGATRKDISEFSSYGQHRHRPHTSHVESSVDGGTFKYYVVKQGKRFPLSPSGGEFPLNVSTFVPAFGEAIVIKNINKEQEIAKVPTQKEEEITSFSEITTTFSCDNDKEKGGEKIENELRSETQTQQVSFTTED